MMTRTLKIAAIAAGIATMPMIGTAANSTTALNSCTKAFVADLTAKTTATLKLRDAHYVADRNWITGGTSELALTARDAHTNHALARAVCTVNAQGAVIELQTAPLLGVDNDWIQ
jgi:hypothetical protein